ncbi:lipopolysaccharide biosynthesis protein [Deferrisoma palaeochoriense]
MYYFRGPRGSAKRGILVLGGGTGLAQALGVLAAPLLARLYTPAEFGVYSVYLAVISVMMVVASFRYDLALLIPEEEGGAAALFVIALACVGLNSGGMLVGATVALKAGWWPDGWPSSLAIWVPLGVAGVGCAQVLIHWSVRGKAYERISGGKIAQAGAQLVGQVVGGSAPGGLIIGDIIGRYVGCTVLVKGQVRKLRLALRFVSMNDVKQAARDYARFPLVSTWGALLNAASLQLPVMIMAGAYGSGMVGQLGLASRVLSLPVSLLGQAIGQVFVGEASARLKGAPGGLLRLYNKLTRNVLIHCILPGVLFFLGCPVLFRTVFGESWYEAGVYARILTPVVMGQLVLVPVAQVLNLIGRNGLYVVLEVMRFLVMVVVLVSFSRSGNAKNCVVAFSAVTTFVYVCMYCVHVVAIREFERQRSLA